MSGPSVNFNGFRFVNNICNGVRARSGTGTSANRQFAIGLRNFIWEEEITTRSSPKALCAWFARGTLAYAGGFRDASTAASRKGVRSTHKESTKACIALPTPCTEKDLWSST